MRYIIRPVYYRFYLPGSFARATFGYYPYQTWSQASPINLLRRTLCACDGRATLTV